jgi:hypothetical protein
MLVWRFSSRRVENDSFYKENNPTGYNFMALKGIH